MKPELNRKRNHNEIISKLFIRLLPVQVLIAMVASVNYIVDGTIAGRCIDSTTVGVIGLYSPMLNILDAAGAVLLGGTAVLCGRSMGSGDIEKTSSIFSLNIVLTFVTGAVLTGASLLFPGAIADLLGASNELKPALMAYINGYAIGIIPRLMGQQIASFLQMERQSKRGFAGIIGMVIWNIILDLLFVYAFSWGVWGLALATSIGNWLYLLVLVPYYFTGKAQLHFRLSSIEKSDTWPLIRIGLPGAMLLACLTLRGLTINRILLTYSGVDGLSALGSFNMISGLFIAFALGVGAVVRMLSSVYYGEGDRDSLRELVKIAFGKMVPLSLVITVLLLVFSGAIAALFFPDTDSEVYHLSARLFTIYAFCVPMVVMIAIASNYLQACGHNLFVHIFSIFDGFISMVIPALILAPLYGAIGVWWSNPIGMLLTITLVPIYAVIFNHGFPRCFDDWLFLGSDFGVPDEDRLDLPIHDMEDVVNTARRVQPFCDEHGIDPKTSYLAALCLEEMAGNILTHGFTKDKHSHSINVRVVIDGDEVLLRLKDDCVPFDPRERAAMTSGDDPLKNFGIRLIMKVADEVNYQHMLGLNVLSITLDTQR